MKKFNLLLILLIIMLCNNSVFAKDTVISMNKYKEEKFNYIIDSYNIEGKKDGKIIGGYILKDNSQEDNSDTKDYRVIVTKYDNNNKITWKYIYGNKTGDKIDSLNYSYDNTGMIDGYLITMHCTTQESITENTIFIKLSFDGKVIFEKNLEASNKIMLSKIKETYTDEGIIDGYVAIGNNFDTYTSYVLKFDRDLNIMWSREYDNFQYLDIENIIKDQKIIGYVVLRQNSDNLMSELIRFNVYGEEPIVIKNDLEESCSYHLAEANDGFILYGDTKQVKLNKGTTSYYLANYNSNNENYWETFGDIAIDNNKIIKLLPLKKDNKIKEYLLLYSNDNIDTNLEIVKIGLEGEIKNKIKKIYDEYYDVSDYIFSNDILYLVGQINCPKDDTCEYDSNSLFLVSDEEKVIEVKDNDSRNILIVTGIFIIMIIGTIIIRRKRSLKYA